MTFEILKVNNAANGSTSYAIDNFRIFGTPCTHPDRAALIALYEATGGDNWTNTWDTTSCDVCNWYGVGCTLIGGQMRVTCIDLDGDPDCSFGANGGNGLTGSLPFLNLPNLQGFYPRFNLGLAGSNLTDFGNSNLPNLEIFSCRRCNLSGVIPDFNFPSLIELSVSWNNLIGGIPDFQNLSNLEFFDCGENLLTGGIPDFSNLPKLIVSTFE